MARYAYTDEQNAWLSEHYPQMTNRELAAAFSERFGEDVTLTAMNAWGFNHHARKERDTRARANSKYTPEMLDYLAEIIPGRSYKQVSELFSERFGMKLTRSMVANLRKKTGVYAGINSGKFRKGIPPTNKGMSWDEQGISEEKRARMRIGQFQKGQKPHNTYHELLDERWDAGELMVYVRPRDRKFTANDWIPMAHFVWMKAHGRYWPKNHKTVYADHDHTNLSPENIVAVPRDVYALITTDPHGKGIKWYDRESLEVAIMHAKVRLKQSRLLRENHTCKACGKTFTARYPSQVNCDECISSGRIRHGARPRVYDYDRIRELSATGMTAVEVAEEVGCSRVTVLNALKAKD